MVQLNEFSSYLDGKQAELIKLSERISILKGLKVQKDPKVPMDVIAEQYRLDAKKNLEENILHEVRSWKLGLKRALRQAKAAAPDEIHPDLDKLLGNAHKSTLASVLTDLEQLSMDIEGANANVRKIALRASYLPPKDSTIVEIDAGITASPDFCCVNKRGEVIEFTPFQGKVIGYIAQQHIQGTPCVAHETVIAAVTGSPSTYKNVFEMFQTDESLKRARKLIERASNGTIRFKVD